MNKYLKKTSKILNKIFDIKYEMTLFLYPILSLYFVMPTLYMNNMLVLNSTKDLILFTFIWYSSTVGLYISTYLLMRLMDFVFEKIKTNNKR